MKKISIFFLAFLCFYTSGLLAQDPLRFQKDVEKLAEIRFDSTKEVILFTGSSSIRFWKDVQDYFPDKNIVNTGFGGSHMSDLLYYHESLILKYRPGQIFIYEGDNDLAGDKSTKEVLHDTRMLVRKIKKDLPDTEIVLISAKPSLARWKLRDKYTDLNRAYKKYADKTKGVDFVDVWPVMLGTNGEPKKDIFVEDGLHMNKKGYDLWAKVIEKYIN